MRSLVLIAALVLGGCTIDVVDKRLTREEVVAALKERDAAIASLVASMKKLEEKKK